MRDAGPLRIGLKYCGGCKPDYDRVALVQTIEEHLRGAAVFVRSDSMDLDLILVVHGCPTACADLSTLGDSTLWSLSGPGDAERFIAHVLDRLQGDV
jgi:hypothetical protein